MKSVKCCNAHGFLGGVTCFVERQRGVGLTDTSYRTREGCKLLARIRVLSGRRLVEKDSRVVPQTTASVMVLPNSATHGRY